MKIVGDTLTKAEHDWLKKSGVLDVAKGIPYGGTHAGLWLELKEDISHGEPIGGVRFKMEFDKIDERDLTVDQMRDLGLLSYPH